VKESAAPERTRSGRRNPELPPPAAAWLARLATERGYSPRTLDGYRHDLEALARLADGRPWGALGEADVRRWVAGRSRGGAAPRSIARALSAWRGFFDWLAERGELAANPARAVRAPRSGKRLPKALSPDQALSLVSAAAPQAVSGRADDAFERTRDRAMLELFYSSGLRLSELTGLDAQYVDDGGYRSASWLDLREAEVTVLGKGGKRRTVPVGRHALDALRAWLDERQRWLSLHPAADGRPLFVSALGRRLANRTVQVRLKRLAQLRGVPADVHPHVLRHSFASHVLQSSGDLRAVQELLGHASIATTQVYTSLNFQRLAKVYDAAHPRARRR
jgi:integrase/recombinase XerC